MVGIYRVIFIIKLTYPEYFAVTIHIGSLGLGLKSAVKLNLIAALCS